MSILFSRMDLVEGPFRNKKVNRIIVNRSQISAARSVGVKRYSTVSQLTSNHLSKRGQNPHTYKYTLYFKTIKILHETHYATATSL